MKNYGLLDKNDSVIIEDEIEFTRKINIEDEDNKIGFMKHKNWLFGKLANKIFKNKYLLISLLFVSIVYYVVLFESLIPMYEAKLVDKENSENKVKRNYHIAYSSKGEMYFFVFHFLFFLFIISFFRTSVMNPGFYDKEYQDLFSLKIYHQLYTKFYFDILSSRKNGNFSSKEGNVTISTTNNRKIEFPNMNFRSNSLLAKKNANSNGNESDYDSIIVDQESFLPQNPNMKKFEKFISKLRATENYKPFWELDCFNYKRRSMRDNFCRFCMILMPERSFHCKKCRKCVKKMDHHCLFINNCIGMNNYKIFFNMLLYSTLTCGCSVIIMFDTVKYVLNEYNFSFYSVTYILTLVLVSLIGSLVFYFMFYHFTLIFKGITQLEDTFRFDERYDDYFVFLKNQTKWQKFTTVFGSNPLLWILPVRVNHAHIEGYTFK